jgi:hypothetical protein
MLIDKLSNGRQLVTAKPTVRRQRHRLEPVVIFVTTTGDRQSQATSSSFRRSSRNNDFGPGYQPSRSPNCI